MTRQAMTRQALLLQAGLVAAVLLATPAAALAAPGVINTSVNLRAGPSVEFPVVNRLPLGVSVEVFGCIRQALWCDVGWGRERGWVAAQYLDYLYDGRYVDLPSYVVDVPVASFVLTSYWSSYYFGRPWYRRHAWWNRHWNTQTHVASQTPAAPAGRGVMPTGVATGRGASVAPAAAGGPGAGAQAMLPANGSAVPVAGGQNRFSGTRPPMMSRAAGQATAMRGGGVPMAARAQFGASRGGLVGLPHAAMGGTPQAGGAMHNGGGGGSRDNGGGRRRH